MEHLGSKIEWFVDRLRGVPTEVNSFGYNFHAVGHSRANLILASSEKRARSSHQGGVR